MLDVFNLYLIVGGMPEAVDVYLKTNNLSQVAQIHDKIIRLYKQDFSKYELYYKLKLQEIYDAMPGQLDQKNKRFQLNSIGKGLSYNKVENDFLWLKDAGVAIPVYNITEASVGDKREPQSVQIIFLGCRIADKPVFKSGENVDIK